jgi:uncharacterized protein (DUF58 family)
MSIPSRNFALLALASVGIAALGKLTPIAIPLYYGYVALILGLLIADYMLSRREALPEVSREAPDIWAVDLPGHYTVTLRNTLQRRLIGGMDENSFTHFRKDFPDKSFSLERGESKAFNIRFFPSVRGRALPGPVFLRYRSSFGLWLLARKFPLADEVNIYPHISSYLALDPFMQRQKAYLRGQHSIRALGEGTDFDSLRDYLPGDDYGKVNWKATARTNRPIVSTFRAERDREIIAVMEGGRLMFAGVSGKSRFDRYLDAIAQLSYALKMENDRLGLLLFDREVRFYRPPTRQPDVLADLFPFHSQHVESDFLKMYAFLSARQPKRSLVLVFTELTDGLTGARAITGLAALARKHQVVVIMLDDPGLYDTAVAASTSEEQMLLSTAALSHLKDKKELCERLRRMNIIVVRTYADKLNAALINKYFELKARNLA